MTDMKRISVSLPDDMVFSLDELRKTEDFKDFPYSELIRVLARRGLDKAKKGGSKK